MRNRLILFFITAILLFQAQQVSSQTIPVDESIDEPTLVLTLEDALKIALSENISVKVADMEVERQQYAKKGTYAALFPQVNASASYQRTIKKQVMYMGGDSDDDSSGGGGMSSMFSGILDPIMYYINQLAAGSGVVLVPYVVPETTETTSSSDGGIEVGRLNTYNGGVSASMPLVNPQLWESLKLSGQQVELAVEQARSSRLNMVATVKQAFYSVLLAKEVAATYKEVYLNAMENCRRTEMLYNVQKASELDLTRAKASVSNAIPNYYNAESSVAMALWQLKAVMGVDLDMDIDTAGELADWSEQMFRDIHENDDYTLDRNSTMKQLALQAEQLASTIRMQKFANLPTLSASFAYSYNAMTNDFKFSEYKWTPYSYVGISLSIPIFSGGRRLNDVRQTQVQARELDLNRLDTERQLKLAIRQSLQTMQTSMETHLAAQDALETARKAYDIAAKSYELGRSTLTDLNDAQLALTQAHLGVSQAIYNFVTAKATLEQTLGYDFNE